MPCDYSKYPPDWKERRAKILERAANRCEFCKVPNYEIILRGMVGRKEAYINCDFGCFDAANGKKLNKANFIPNNRNATKIILTVAHLDHDKENWDVKDERLKALCQKCHLRYDMPRHIHNRKVNAAKKKGLTELPLNNSTK